MSLFARVAARTGIAGADRAPLAVPKGLAGARLLRAAAEPAADPEEAEVAALRRAAVGQQPDEDPARPLRRAAADDLPKEDDVALLRRAARADEDPEAARPLAARAAGPARAALGAPPDEEDAATLRRAAADAAEGDDLAPIRRTGPDEADDLAPLRRSAEKGVAALRRAAPPEEDEAAPAAPLRRTPPSDAETLDAETSPKPPEFGAEAEPPGLRALRRDAGVAPGAGPQTGGEPAAAGWGARPVEPSSATFILPPPAAPPGLAPAERPRVVIEHVEVQVHEPATAAQGRAPDLGRALRARYLGGL